MFRVASATAFNHTSTDHHRQAPSHNSAHTAESCRLVPTMSPRISRARLHSLRRTHQPEFRGRPSQLSASAAGFNGKHLKPGIQPFCQPRVPSPPPHLARARGSSPACPPRPAKTPASNRRSAIHDPTSPTAAAHGPCRNRTYNLAIKSRLLCQLS